MSVSATEASARLLYECFSERGQSAVSYITVSENTSRVKSEHPCTYLQLAECSTTSHSDREYPSYMRFVHEHCTSTRFDLDSDERVTGFSALFEYETRQLYGASFKISKLPRQGSE